MHLAAAALLLLLLLLAHLLIKRSTVSAAVLNKLLQVEHLQVADRWCTWL
jgi:hypothetical protein